MYINANKLYEPWLSRYHGKRSLYPRAYVSKKIKKFLSEGFLPKKPELLYDLGRFLYFEIKKDSMVIQWLAINLIDRASSDGLTIATEYLKSILEILRKHAIEGELISQSLLGRYLALKDSSSTEAGMWLKKAADKSDPESELLLSICYLSALCGLEEDKGQAVYYAQRAVDHGNLKAAFNLACFYADGIGCEKNIKKAEKYFFIARDNGHPAAQKELDTLYSAEKPQSNPDAQLWTAFVQMLSNKIIVDEKTIEKAVERLLRGQAEIVQTNKENTKEIIDNTNQQSEQTRIHSTVEHEKTRKMVDSIPEKTRKLIFAELDKVICEYKASFAKFEDMHKQMQSDISEIGQIVDKTNVEMEKITSQMQAFFDGMDQKCRVQVEVPECRCLRDACENELKSIFGKYWDNKDGKMYLLDSTKDSLIAARVLLACAEREELYDCRGIVISATSALERELKARFYNGIRQYFFDQGVWSGETEEDLPANLQKKIITGEDKFTLGDVRYILYCENYNSKIPQNNYKEKQIACLRNYLRDIVLSDDIVLQNCTYGGRYYNAVRPEDIFIYNGRPCFTQKLVEIANDYRNPAAHTSETSKDKALQCCKVVIGQRETEIAKIEGLLFELLKLTEKFKHQEKDT